MRKKPNVWCLTLPRKKQFTTRLKLNGKVLDTVKEMKLLGTIVTNKLKWDKNTKFLVRKAYARMELLRQMTTFTKSIRDKIQIYKTYIRSVVEQSCVVWNSSLSNKNKNELERVQKVAVRLITKSDLSYNEKLKELNLESLSERRNILCERFAGKCIKNKKIMNIFNENKKHHKMKLRQRDKYQVKHANTVRLQRSAIPTMTKHLNLKHNQSRNITQTN